MAIKRKYSWWKIFQEFEFYNLILNRYEQKCWCRYNVITLGSFFITSFSYKENNQLFFYVLWLAATKFSKQLCIQNQLNYAYMYTYIHKRNNEIEMRFLELDFFCLSVLVIASVLAYAKYSSIQYITTKSWEDNFLFFWEEMFSHKKCVLNVFPIPSCIRNLQEYLSNMSLGILFQ